MHDMENPKQYKLFREHAKRFAILKINDLFGISLNDYLNLTNSEINDLNKIAEEHISKRDNVLESLEKEMDQ